MAEEKPRKPVAGLRRLTDDESYHMFRGIREKVMQDEELKIAEAREKGIEEGIIIAATAMLKAGYTSGVVSNLLELSPEKVGDLKRDISLTLTTNL